MQITAVLDQVNEEAPARISQELQGLDKDRNAFHPVDQVGGEEQPQSLIVPVHCCFLFREIDRITEMHGLFPQGEFIECGEMSAIDNLLNAFAAELKIPLITGFPIGHGLKNTALPLGIPARLDTDLMTLSILEPCVI